MEVSALQKARYAYTPKLPACLSREITRIGVELGSPTESIADQGKLKALFKNSYGKPLASFVQGNNDKIGRVLAVGVILSGGQAPGGA
ncbi:hypothetical protein AGMMS49546_26880 [Spirochaetia bacterium]|nr:hypothetical protein AGMMS49546_26880 [Spirochaetia bacterium]